MLRGSMASEQEALSKKQLAKYRSRLRLLLFVSARQIVGRRLASLASAHESLEEALRLAGQTSVFSASAPNSPVVSHVADVWSPAELRSETAASGEHCHALHSLWLNTDQNSSCAFPEVSMENMVREKERKLINRTEAGRVMTHCDLSRWSLAWLVTGSELPRTQRA
ncbi:hypothetical protein L1887_50344 [Cichorium endivia]|jgi:hypothetical protein|nr:hypothetical protein L1887_50344 [Cichorium endivia]